MAIFLSAPLSLSIPNPSSYFLPNFPKPASKTLILLSNPNPKRPISWRKMPTQIQASPVGNLDPGLLQLAVQLVQSTPASWKSALLSNALIFGMGSPILVSGLSLYGIAAAFLLGTLTWRAFRSSGFLLVATYHVTTFKIVPRGTEGAVCIEGTFSGLLASILLVSVGCFMGLVTVSEAVLCVVASQIANLGESIIGAELQDKDGFLWLNNDVVNVINISMGSILAVLMQRLILQSWLR